MVRMIPLKYRPLIGLTATVRRAVNPSQCGLTGLIVDETHAMITLDDGNHRRHIPKVTALFDILKPNGTLVQIAGKKLIGHPAERLRRAKRRRW